MLDEKEKIIRHQKAVKEYRKRSLKQIAIRFYPKDHELFNKIKASVGEEGLNEMLLGLLRREFGDK